MPASCSSSAPPCLLPLLPLPLQLVCACLGGGGRQQVTPFPSFMDINVKTKGCEGFFFTFLLRLFLRPRKQSRREFVLKKIKRAADGSHAGALTLKEPNRFPPTRQPVRVSFSEGNGRKTHSHNVCTESHGDPSNSLNAHSQTFIVKELRSGAAAVRGLNHSHVRLRRRFSTHTHTHTPSVPGTTPAASVSSPSAAPFPCGHGNTSPPAQTPRDLTRIHQRQRGRRVCQIMS